MRLVGLGVLLYEMLVGEAPFSARTTSAILVAILRHAADGRLVFPMFFSKDAAELIRACCSPPAAGWGRRRSSSTHSSRPSTGSRSSREVTPPYTPAAEVERSAEQAQLTEGAGGMLTPVRTTTTLRMWWASSCNGSGRHDPAELVGFSEPDGGATGDRRLMCATILRYV